MGTRLAPLKDVVQGAGRVSRLRLLAPLRYLAIEHPEKKRYDFVAPVLFALIGWAVYMLIEPKPALFGDRGLLRFSRDLLIMAVPFMVGALAAVSMGAPGKHLDRRPLGSPVTLANEVLTLRQFTCYLLGYLSFIGLVTLMSVVAAEWFRDSVFVWTNGYDGIRFFVRSAGAFGLSLLLSFLSVTVLWALYFLTDIVNQGDASGV